MHHCFIIQCRASKERLHVTVATQYIKSFFLVTTSNALVNVTCLLSYLSTCLHQVFSLYFTVFLNILIIDDCVDKLGQDSGHVSATAVFAAVEVDDTHSWRVIDSKKGMSVFPSLAVTLFVEILHTALTRYAGSPLSFGT